jgi:topoisomerase-4 subunit A
MKIRGEQDELAKEREKLIVAARQQGQAEEADQGRTAGRCEEVRRRAPLAAGRARSRAGLDETELVASEPVTVVLSSQGLGARGQGPRHRRRGASLPRRRRPAGGGAQRVAAPAGGVPRFQRPQLFDRGAHPALGARQRRTADRPLLAAGRARLRPGMASGENDQRFVLASSTATASSPASRTSPAATRPARRCSRCPGRTRAAAGGGGRHGDRPRRRGHQRRPLLAFPLANCRNSTRARATS